MIKSLLIFVLLAPSVHARNLKEAAGGDICVIRPDLCGKAVAKKCRPPGRSYSVLEADLPVCKKVLSPEEELDAEFNQAEVQRPVKAATRANSGLDFETYLQNNANHPALARKPASFGSGQAAFVPVVRKSSLDGSPTPSSVEKAIEPARESKSNSAPEGQ